MSPNKDPKKNRSGLKGPTFGIADNFPNRHMWKEIAEERKGEFKITHDPGRTYEIHTVSIPYKKWSIVITVSDARPLRFLVAFSSLQDFNLTISWEDFIEKIIKKFGKPEIEVGWKEFDDRYLIKTNHSDTAKRILSKDIQKALLKHNVNSVTYHTDKKTHTAELRSLIQRHAGNREMINELIGMHEALIDNLESSKTIH